MVQGHYEVFLTSKEIDPMNSVQFVHLYVCDTK